MNIAVTLGKKPESGVLAYVDLTVQAKGILGPDAESEITINGFRVVTGSKGVFVSKPSRKYTDTDGREGFSDYFSTGRATWQELQKKILAAYEDAKAKGGVK